VPAKLPCPIGKRFGAIVVVGEAEHRLLCGQLRRQWLLRCDCGTELKRTVSQANSGRTTACDACAVKKRVKHGESHSKGQAISIEYMIWNGLRNRCNNPKDKNYPRYGGRGIAVCERWNSYQRFLADMGRRPTPDHSIDRIDNDKGYEPGNCRWATPLEQGRNRRNNRLLTFNGKTQGLSVWAEELGGSGEALGGRLRRGHVLDVALTQPVRAGQILDANRDGRKRSPRRDLVLANLAAEPVSPVALAKRLGLNRHNVRTALARLEQEGLAERIAWGQWRRCG
jgi:hypothetical protein